ncbi:MAG: flagellar biosynthesis anti-sigma factor FlgM [Armatimonadota bacterium]
MQISLEEVRKAMAAYRQSRQEATQPLEPVPEPVQVPEEENARLVQEIACELCATPDIRTERVEELKRRIDAGEYSVSAEMVISAIIRRMLADRIR